VVNKKTIIALLIAGLTGCTMAPVYQRPAMPIAEAWPTGAAYNNNDMKNDTPILTADIGWREFFVDPTLQQLIEIALKNNRDLRIAVLNIEKARAEYQIQRADLFPSIGASGQGTHQRSSANTSGQRTLSRQYTASVGFSAYELDLFGRVRSLKDQALALYSASEEDRRNAHISLVAEVANAYLTLLADNESLRLAKETHTSQEASYQLTKHSFDAGVVSLLDLNRAKTTVAAARSDEALYTSRVARDKNALAVLLGAPIPDDLPLNTNLHQAKILLALPAGLPADLLQRRPDIMAAEHQLKAANANIGAARAAFFPSITLTANAGTASTALSQLFKAGSGVWSFIPQVTLPIFTAGKNRANLDIAHILKDIHIAQYEKTIQVAFKEVADALAQRSTLMDQLAAQQALTDATEKTYHLSELRYRQGIDSYLGLLDAQRSLYSAQQGLINTKLSQLTNLVNLYKTLGGGWNEKTVEASSFS
jgi:multidrug efflux system outer membrane protein